MNYWHDWGNVFLREKTQKKDFSRKMKWTYENRKVVIFLSFFPPQKTSVIVDFIFELVFKKYVRKIPLQ
jgi:hypothetical protein